VCCCNDARRQKRRYSVKLNSKNWHLIPGRGERGTNCRSTLLQAPTNRKAEASQIDVAATAIGAALVVVSRAERSRRARIRIIGRGSRLVVSPRRITVTLRCSGPVRSGIDRALIAYSNSVNHLASVRVNPPLEKNTAKCVTLDGHAIRVRAVYRSIEITSLRNGNRTNRQASKRQSDDDAARTSLTRHA
jgi:hypothetical protein